MFYTLGTVFLAWARRLNVWFLPGFLREKGGNAVQFPSVSVREKHENAAQFPPLFVMTALVEKPAPESRALGDRGVLYNLYQFLFWRRPYQPFVFHWFPGRWDRFSAFFFTIYIYIYIILSLCKYRHNLKTTIWKYLKPHEWTKSETKHLKTYIITY